MIRTARDFALGGALFRREGNPVIYCRFVWRGRKVVRSTGATEERAARAVAWGIYLSETGAQGAEAVPRLRNASATVGEVCEAYLRGRARLPRVSEQTARGNVLALTRVLELVFPSSKAMELRTSVLDAAFVHRWRDARRKKFGAESGDRKYNVGANSELRKARGVFARDARRELFGGLNLPDLAGFLEVGRLAEPVAQWIPLSPGVVVEMDRKAGEELRVESPQLWVIFELARFCGLRSTEILCARWHWLERWGDDYLLAVVQRDGRSDPAGVGFRPKSRDRRVPVSGARVAAWREALAGMGQHPMWPGLAYDPGATAPIVQAVTETGRKFLVQRAACDWVSQWMPGRTMKLHELRKLAGSEIATRENSITAAADFLGDTVQVAERHYVRLLRAVRPL